MTTKTRARKPPKAPAALAPLSADAVLLAIDASSSAVGWAVFKAGRFSFAGLAKAPAGWESPRRIRANATDILEVMLDHGATDVAMEWQGPLRHARGRNVNGLAVLGQAQGYLLAAIERECRHVRVALIGEREWTRIDGWNATKEKRAERVRLLCPEYRAAVERDSRLDAGYDIADAIGLGFYRLSMKG